MMRFNKITTYDELQRFLPIDHGWLKVVSVFAAFISTGLLIVTTATIFIFIGISMFTKSADPIIIFVSDGIVSLMFSIPYCLKKSSLPREYWKRNVQGYKLWCWLENGEVNFAISDRKETRDATVPLIGIVLGGWFHSHSLPDIYWKIKRVAVLNNYDTPMIFLKIEDAKGNLVNFNIEIALRLIQRGIGTPVNLPLVFDEILTEFERKEAAALSDLRYQKDLVETLFHTMIKTTKEIKDSTRFGKSSEGKKIRLELIDSLLQLLPADHPNRAELQEQLMDEDKKAQKRKAS